MTERGLFITVEGGEGAGKTTALDYLERALTDAGVAVVRTREPGGTAMAEKLRDLLLHAEDVSIDPLAELLLIFASRAQHLRERIRPALAAGHWVLCDRFTDASYAYQGAGRGLGAETVATLERFVQGDQQPDLTLLIDVPVEVGMERARGRGSLDRFESEDLAFFQRVRSCYLDRAAKSSGRFRVIDGCRSIAEVQRSLADVIAQLLRVDRHASPPVP
ncbi:MAG: dTMP kinase [Halieaceae bacterium]|jgi:dTMP kinase|nr:dTMP kinase [Halieaceae bacterium]